MVYEHIVPGRSVNVTDPDKRYNFRDGFQDMVARPRLELLAELENLKLSPCPTSNAPPVHHAFSYQPSREVLGEQVAQEL
jgi:hypothetical protein